MNSRRKHFLTLAAGFVLVFSAAEASIPNQHSDFANQNTPTLEAKLFAAKGPGSLTPTFNNAVRGGNSNGGGGTKPGKNEGPRRDFVPKGTPLPTKNLPLTQTPPPPKPPVKRLTPIFNGAAKP